MKIISFLGFNNYQTTTYLHPEPGRTEAVSTAFFQEALVEFYKPETLIVLLTKTAENDIPRGADRSNWQALQDCLKDKPVKKLEPITNIPERNTPDDIWSIFEKITSCLNEGDEVIFDITHSFRSIPIVSLLAVSYLRLVRKVSIKGLVYGAFEAKNENNQTPSFDLLPIVSLLDWLTATDQFLNTGSGTSLAKLLENSSTDLAQDITKISQSLELLRPTLLMEEAAKLPQAIQQATPIVSNEFPPFKPLLERVEQDYSQFALSNSQDSANSKDFLLQLLKMIRWYVDKNQFVQALSAAREWLPSLLCHHFGLDIFEYRNRDEMEILLVGGTRKISETEKRESKYLKEWNQIDKEKRKRLTNLCNDKLQLSNLRNDVLHAGFRKKSKDVEEIINLTKEILKEIEAIAEEWGIK